MGIPNETEIKEEKEQGGLWVGFLLRSKDVNEPSGLSVSLSDKTYVRVAALAPTLEEAEKIREDFVRYGSEDKGKEEPGEIIKVRIVPLE